MELTILNLDTNNSIIFDDTTFILNNISTDSTQVTHSKSKTIKQIGEYITASSVSSRSIDLIGYILGSSKEFLEIQKGELLNLINPLQNIRLIVNKDKHIDVKATGNVLWGKNWDSNNDQFVKFTISFIAPTTLFKDLDASLVSFSPWENTFIFPFSIPSTGLVFGHRTRGLFTTIYNSTNIPLGCKFTFTALSTVVNPRITNVNTNKFMQINITLEPNDTLIVTTEFNSKSITLNDSNAISKFDFTNSEWLMINQGDNTFTYSTENNSDNSLNIELEYYQTYWGVV